MNLIEAANTVMESVGLREKEHSKRKTEALHSLILRWGRESYDKLQVRSAAIFLIENGWFGEDRRTDKPFQSSCGNFIANSRSAFSHLHANLGGERTGGGPAQG